MTAALGHLGQQGEIGFSAMACFEFIVANVADGPALLTQTRAPIRLSALRLSANCR